MSPLLRRVSRSRPLARGLTAAWRLGVLPTPNRVVTARLSDGRLMTLDLRDATHRNMWLERFEPAESAVVRGLAPGSVVVDVGAHIGWFATLASIAAGPSGRVLAVEPFAASRAFLEHNLAANGCTNTTVRSEAIGAAPGLVSIGRQAGSDSGSVTAGQRAHDALETVARQRLDDVVEAVGLTQISLLKVDVEGLERQVLDGAETTLGRTSRVLLELNRSALTNNGVSSEELVTFLRGAGFDDQSYLGDQPTEGRLPNFTNLLAARS